MNFPGLSLDGQDNIYIIWELFPQPTSYPHAIWIFDKPREPEEPLPELPYMTALWGPERGSPLTR
jgi:hypothetical protein